MALNDTVIRNVKPQERPFKLFDERGLFLLVKPNGTRLWRFKYTHQGREKLISFGDYRDVPLKRAREKRDDARRLVADGVDPSAERQAARAERAHTFAGIAEEWLETKRKVLSEGTWERDRDQLVKVVGPALGNKPISTIEAPDLLAVLKRVEAKGRHDTAHRIRAVVGRVFRYAIATGRAKHDISADLKGALAARNTQHHPGFTEPAKVGELLRAIDGYEGQAATAMALKLAPYVFVRPVELRTAEWAHIDLANSVWRIPGEIMKMGELHIVPLARQAVAILSEMKVITGDGKYVFPAIGPNQRPLSENTLNAGLRRLGYNTQTEHCAHGFRTTASTLLNEQGFHPDLIELQLAHAERNKVRAAYNRAQRLEERQRMMQHWADYLDALRSGAKVIPLHHRAA